MSRVITPGSRQHNFNATASHPFGKFGIGSHSTPAINGAQAAKSNKRYPQLRHGDNCLVCPKCDTMRAVAVAVAAARLARISALEPDDGRRTPTTPAGGDNDQAGVRCAVIVTRSITTTS
ncbi:MAG TPA: hypothetical protein PKJ50_15135, partial [Casimicrobium huifangae]|nr:hypothetical protein [Casimicrobium huifangae]